jgi:hypothetical protein
VSRRFKSNPPQQHNHNYDYNHPYNYKKNHGQSSSYNYRGKIRNSRPTSRQPVDFNKININTSTISIETSSNENHERMPTDDSNAIAEDDGQINNDINKTKNKNNTNNNYYRNNKEPQYTNRDLTSTMNEQNKTKNFRLTYSYKVKITCSETLDNKFDKPECIKEEVKKFKTFDEDFYCMRSDSNVILLFLKCKCDYDACLRTWRPINIPAINTSHVSPFNCKIQIENISKFYVCIHGVNFNRSIQTAFEKAGITNIQQLNRHCKGEINNIIIYERIIKDGAIYLNGSNDEIPITPYINPKYRSLIQCMNCQDLGHYEDNCHGPTRCVNCGGRHQENFCTITESDMFKCVNCGGNHRADYYACSMRIAILDGSKIKRLTLKECVFDLETKLSNKINNIQNEMSTNNKIVANAQKMLADKIDKIALDVISLNDNFISLKSAVNRKSKKSSSNKYDGKNKDNSDYNDLLFSSKSTDTTSVVAVTNTAISTISNPSTSNPGTNTNPLILEELPAVNIINLRTRSNPNNNNNNNNNQPSPCAPITTTTYHPT